MAVTAQLEVIESSVNSGQKCQFVLTLTNAGGSDVDVTGVSIFASPNQSANMTVPVFYPQTAVTVAAGGTLVATCGGVFFAGVADDGDGDDDVSEQTAFEVTASVALDDSTSVASNTVTVQVTPVFEPTIPMPSRGQLRFDSNNNSALLAVI